MDKYKNEDPARNLYTNSYRSPANITVALEPDKELQDILEKALASDQ